MEFEYGKRLKKLREINNISQEKLAAVIGVKRSSYNQFEQQYDIIPIKRLNQISNFFNVSIDYLLGLNNNMKYQNIRENIDINISSERLKSFRKEQKLTQNSLAKSLNISRSIITFHENKRTVIGTPFLSNLCKKYNISADYLLGKIDNPKYI